jgi:uncharacterized protein YyaL (SSP411 family)
MTDEKRANRLLKETSPYLRQHAYNPVDWYPWGEEALERARRENKPILLSVGYSACHWCHVMEHESFENEAIASRMNEQFVNIKVDREERPDLDEIYMAAVQAISGSGGWPMTMFLTPDLRPFYGGTYYPPEDRHGRPGFARVLDAVAARFRDQPEKIEEAATQLLQALQQNTDFLQPGADPGQDIVEEAFNQLQQNFDSTYGGFGSAPKFPNSMSLGLLLRHYRRSGNKAALDMVELSLEKMAHGGMYDQLGGGFHRYSVDEHWLVPHFEKMLYDNALLTWVYLEAYQATEKPLYSRVARQVLDYVLREMTQPEGGFYATQDADSEGEEGKFFVWLPEEVEEILGEEDARLFARYYGVTPEGNFEHGQSILHVQEESAVLASLLKVDEEAFAGVLEEGRRRLLEVRQRRVAPGRDDKILVAWNGMMISAMARAYQVLGEEAYLTAATSAADFILTHMVQQGRLLHSYKDGQAHLLGYQDDYACFINGLIDLYEASFELRWLSVATELNQTMLDLYWDEGKGGFFYTEATAEDLIVRTKNPFDNAVPSGNSIGALVLLRLAALTGNMDLREKAVEILQLFGNLMQRSASSCAQMICALDFYQESPYEIALTGTAGQQDDFLQVLHRRFLPNKVVMASGRGGRAEDLIAQLPLMEGKVGTGDDMRAYVCRDFVCSQPVSEVEDFLGLLDGQN